jgi:FAD/FMN-containing dehydrogenase/Fe-S oxidoreductase
MIREIPYNYTSFSDREIVIRFLGDVHWKQIEALRDSRRTGRSARMLCEVLGELWVVTRNPYVRDDLIRDSRRQRSFITGLNQRLEAFEQRLNANVQAAELLQAARHAVAKLQHDFQAERQLRARIKKRLAGITNSDNLDFGALARVGHATDATDWRVAIPFVVITPDTEQEAAPIVSACIECGLTLIPRGGGTGYTGSAVPLHDRTAVINTEKLQRLSAIEQRVLPGLTQPVATIDCEVGVVTSRVARVAATQQLAFAVDPTSQDASCIGGNIAMNAGGKKAVLWGTTLDNLVSWRMVTPEGDWLEVERIGHNLGKIHTVPTAHFRIQRFAPDGITPRADPEELSIPAQVFRRPGLGKDVTDKVLAGLPGIQKEGCDGLITSARFLLHPLPKHICTLCLEFFGADLEPAVTAIVAIKSLVDADPEVQILSLEHLDERYIRAVNYSTKASRRERPKMILLMDLIADDDVALQAVTKTIIATAVARQGEGFVATRPAARQRFWLDRSRTAAISQHTNAFKINEDVVIPLEQLATYSREIERINIEQSIRNKDACMAAILDYLASADYERHLTHEYEPLSEEARSIISAKQRIAQEIVMTAQQRWQGFLAALDEPAVHHLDLLRVAEQQVIEPDDTLLDLLLRRTVRQSYTKEVGRRLDDLFAGQEWERVREQISAIHRHWREARLFVALHMHAGDGNVHTNIPVHSSNYAMLREAERIVDRIMALAHQLGGAISGEHGIGLTKFHYLAADKQAAFAEYKRRVDPKGHFNPGKLLAGAHLNAAYTPSLRLVEQEALILEETEFGALNHAIRHCLRCGKCKAACMTHVPQAQLLYSPRNKILGAGLLIEAVLYEEQTRRGISSHHFAALNDLAAHCTICHQCRVPCPVTIDFGDVTILLRRILDRHGHQHPSLPLRATLHFLKTQQPRLIHGLRAGLVTGGFHALNGLHAVIKRLSQANTLHDRVAATAQEPSRSRYWLEMAKRPVRVSIPKHTYRQQLAIEDHHWIPILSAPERVTHSSEAVFYFPGCGSERLFSDIGLATLALLCASGVRVILPPGYLCCGYPQRAVGLEADGQRLIFKNRVLFHRLAHTLNYLDIKHVLVSCGTCLDQLRSYQFDRIFPESRLLDIHEYLMECGLVSAANPAHHYLYHDPCHTPMHVHAPLTVAQTLLSQNVSLSARCCGEAGTLSISRPDIANQVRFRKQEEITAELQRQTIPAQQTTLLTACPACLQGLSKYTDSTGVQVKYLIIELAERYLGAHWQDAFLKQIQQGGLERVLL